MELLIVSGLSGAGKSVAMNALEDIGFFCIDNVPAGLLPSITAFSEAGDSQLERVALSMDVRGCRTSEEIERALDKLDEQGVDYKILFLDAPDDVLMRRYSETRRRHPISIAEGISTREAFAKERKILKPLQERADYVINTALLSTAQNKERICDLFAKNGGAKGAMRLTVMSFGFKFGIPPEADLVLDVRCLPNPFYVPELKHKTDKYSQDSQNDVLGNKRYSCICKDCGNRHRAAGKCCPLKSADGLNEKQSCQRGKENQSGIFFLVSSVWMDSAESSHQRIRPEITARQADQTGNAAAKISKYRESHSADQ